MATTYQRIEHNIYGYDVDDSQKVGSLLVKVMTGGHEYRRLYGIAAEGGYEQALTKARQFRQECHTQAIDHGKVSFVIRADDGTVEEVTPVISPRLRRAQEDVARARSRYGHHEIADYWSRAGGWQ